MRLIVAIVFGLCALGLLAPSVRAEERKKFTIVVERGQAQGDFLPNQIIVNGAAIGSGLENDRVKVPAGTYTGKLRYYSEKHVQGPFGTIGQTGDFLLEVSGVPGRTDILFHGGTKPEHSKGCILLGGIAKDGNGVRFVPDTTTLRKLRLAFYGTDTPNATPDVDIEIVVKDAGASASGCDWQEAVPCMEVVPMSGKRCGKKDSVEIDVRNKCPFAVKIVTCLEKSAGGWTCGPDGKFDDGTKPNEKINNYVCAGTGTTKVYAMPIDKFRAGKCKYPTKG